MAPGSPRAVETLGDRSHIPSGAPGRNGQGLLTVSPRMAVNLQSDMLVSQYSRSSLWRSAVVTAVSVGERIYKVSPFGCSVVVSIPLPVLPRRQHSILSFLRISSFKEKESSLIDSPFDSRSFFAFSHCARAHQHTVISGFSHYIPKQVISSKEAWLLQNRQLLTYTFRVIQFTPTHN